MKTTLAKFIGSACMTMALIVSAQTLVAAQDKQDISDPSPVSAKSAEDRIVGVWETTVTPRDCITGQQLGPSFQGLSTYNLGGTVAEYGGLNPNFPSRSPGHGTWQAAPWLGEDSYLLTFVFMPLTSAGLPAGKQKVTQTIEYRRYLDDFRSSGNFQFFTPNGVLVASGCSTAVATRFR